MHLKTESLSYVLIVGKLNHLRSLSGEVSIMSKCFRHMALCVAGAGVIIGCVENTESVGPEEGITAADCRVCHGSNAGIVAIQNQWNASAHVTGNSFARSNLGDCAGCHSDQGFRERISSADASLSISGVNDPAPANCRTCHRIHEDYDLSDYDLRVSPEDEVPIHVAGEQFGYGKGNVCVVCHQPTESDRPPEAGSDGIVEISSKYWGPHYGTASAILKGTGGYEVEGSMPYRNSAHADMVDACVRCHMSGSYGNEAGGHRLTLSYPYHGHTADLVKNCTPCHESSIKNFNINSTRDTIGMLKDSLASLLIARNLLDSASLRAIPGTYTALETGALWNYLMVKYDGGMGAHNYPYEKALLVNSLEALR